MKSTILALAIASALAVPSITDAAVLTFEDFGSPNYFTSTYHGFNFGNNGPDDPWFYTNEATTAYTPHSGTFFVGTAANADPAGPSQMTAAPAITSTTGFVFNGAWFSGYDSIAYALYDGSTLVYTSSPSASLNSTSQFISSGYSGSVTGVVILGSQQYFAMDDFTYNESTTSVPEPGILSLTFAGLAAIGLQLRRRKRTAVFSGVPN